MIAKVAVERPFAQVDVFSDRPLLGNPVAVVLDAVGLSAERMQAFTDWTNLSEATFVLPATRSEADYRVRIFCPGTELPFAGHPTLGTCHAWLESGGSPAGDLIVQECEAGLIRIRRHGDILSFAAPPLRRGGLLEDEALARVTEGLGLAASDVVASQWCDNGPPWQAVLLESADHVKAVVPDRRALDGMFVGVVGPYDAGDVHVEVRAFFPGSAGTTEDPVTGSLNAALAPWLVASGKAPRSYVAGQGGALGRDGRVHIDCIGTDVWVGGESTTVLSGLAVI